MSLGLEGKQVIITGGDGGLGRAVVEAFAAAGATCHLPTLAAAGGEARAGVRITGKVDLTDDGAVTAYFAGLPPLWASVHLAGGYAAKPIADTSRADLDRLLQLNVVTAFLCCREAVKALRQSGGGRIVNVAARVVEVPVAGAVAYSVSKAGVAALTRSLAVETRSEEQTSELQPPY